MRINKLILEFSYRINGFGIWWGGDKGIPQCEVKAIRHTLRLVGPKCVFDVGANRGDFAALVKEQFPSCQVICFEPQPRTVALLKRRFTDDSVQIESLGLSDTPGQSTLYEMSSVASSSVASMNRDSVLEFDNDTSEYEISLSTVDEYCAEKSIAEIDFLKIDTEGYDFHVIRGAEKMIKDGCVKVISFEIIRNMINTRVFFKDFFNFLNEYDIYRIFTNGAMYKVGEYRYKHDEIFVPSSYIAIHKSVD